MYSDCKAECCVPKVYLCAHSSSNTFCSSRVQTGCAVVEPEGRVLCVGTSGESTSERGDSKAMACVTGSRLESGDGTIACSCVVTIQAFALTLVLQCHGIYLVMAKALALAVVLQIQGFALALVLVALQHKGWLFPFSLSCFQLSLHAFSLEVELQQYLQAPPCCNHSSHIILFVSSSLLL